MNCKYLTTRSKNYKKYFYCRHPSIKSEINYSKCNFCTLKEYKEQKSIPNKKRLEQLRPVFPNQLKKRFGKEIITSVYFVIKTFLLNVLVVTKFAEAKVEWGQKKIYLQLVTSVIKNMTKEKINQKCKKWLGNIWRANILIGKLKI